MLVRDARESDFAHVLRLNAESVHFLSPLDPQRLTWLHGMAAYHRVVEWQGRVEAFLLGFREGSAYDSLNYGWFTARYRQFLYIDRIVVGSSLQRQGAGRRLYEDLMQFARRAGVQTITCEIDVDPPNEISRRFHQGFGFAEVGSQIVGASRKRVSLQVKEAPC
ncbi:MAG: GNAT family N-acetyltransferase [Burkholderiaceae bacterium]